MRRIGGCIVWACIYTLFLVASCLIRRQMLDSGALEIWSWDYRDYVRLFHEWGYVLYTGFRHPGLGIVYSPIVLATHIWSDAYVLIMPMIATAMAWVVWWLAGAVGVMVLMMFPATWILAGTPESFPVAELSLALSTGIILKVANSKAWIVAILCAMICGMITISNGLKPMLAFLVLAMTSKDHELKKRVWPLLVSMGAAVVIGVAFFYVRALVSGKDVLECIQRTIVWVPAERMRGKELYDFFVRPVGEWQSCVIYPLAAYGLWRLLRSKSDAGSSLLVVLGAMFLVDVVIHWVCGWGMNEAWVYAPHWIWMLPVVIGRGIQLKVGCLSGSANG